MMQSVQMPAPTASLQPAGDFFGAVQGLNYVEVLGAVHRNLQPSNYLEIGTFTGATLRLAKCPTIAVDPEFRIQTDVTAGKPVLSLYQMPSDEFFRRFDAKAILGASVHMAFLDGMHRIEFLLRDFINTERLCCGNSVIVLHDCLPGDAHITARSMGDPRRAQSRFPDFWAGDVWKMLPILRRHRPDLKIRVANAAPTGLVFITGVDCRSTILDERYFDIVEEWLDVDLDDYGVGRLHAEAAATNARDFALPDGAARYFRP